MSEYKRLTKKDSYYDKDDYELDLVIELDKCYHEEVQDMDIICEKLNRLAELEDKIENGTLREVPCKAGDTIYFDTYRRGDSIGVQPHKVARVQFVVGIESASGTPGTEIQEYEFGKSVFFTAEEAEAKLKKVMEEIK